MNKCISFLVELKWNKNTPFFYNSCIGNVIKEGNIAEQGTHNELIALNGIYKNMVELQNKNNGVKIL